MKKKIIIVTGVLLLAGAVAFAAGNLIVTGDLLVETGKVGIGTSTPTEKLDVVGGNIKTDSNLLVNGNVGIGTSTPQTDLDVSGDASVSGKITALKTFQVGQVEVAGSWGGNGPEWTAVTFPLPFDTAPVVVATGLLRSSGGVPDVTGTPFFVVVKNVSTTGFEFKAVDYDGSNHEVASTAEPDYINWMAIVQ